MKHQWFSRIEITKGNPAKNCQTFAWTKVESSVAWVNGKLVGGKEAAEVRDQA